MLTVNLRQTPRRRDTAGYTQRPRGVRTTHKSRLFLAVRDSFYTWRIRAPLSTRNSLSFRRLSHKFNNLVVRKYRPVSPVFARRSRSDCSPRAASIDTLSVPPPMGESASTKSLFCSIRQSCGVPPKLSRRHVPRFCDKLGETVWSA